MSTPLEEENYLTIQLLSYDKPTELTERFYFLEMSTLQATTLFPQNTIIIGCKIFASTDDNKILDERTIEGFKTIVDFNNYFLNNRDYYIQNCELEFENEMKLNSHDDGEVSIQFHVDHSRKLIIDTIFEKYNLNKLLIPVLKSKPGHCIAIDKQNNIIGDYENFDDYVENGRG